MTPPRITAEAARELAIAEHVCVRPLMREVTDQETGQTSRVAIACGATRESVCPPCAHKARILRMQQCAEGWHRTDEPEHENTEDGPADNDSADDTNGESPESSRRVRSTRRRDDAAELPRMPTEDRTIGRTFTGADGQMYRPSMFLTLTMPSYGRIHGGAPADPATYDYRRAALDALHFPKLVDRFWQNLRRVAGYRVQYFAAVEPQARLAPHLHAALRGTIPRKLIRQVVKATYVQVWWPRFDAPVYTDRLPAFDRDLHRYIDTTTGELLPTWDEALDQLEWDPETAPVHTMRFGSQVDMAGIIAPSRDADRAIRYLTKYLTKNTADPVGDDDPTLAREQHIDRLHAELRYLPCSPRCANWLRYGINPQHPSPGMMPGRCPSKAHDRECLGLGGRRVLVSRQWSGRTLADHKADRATVVRETLRAAGIAPPDIERMAANVTTNDGRPRFIWRDAEADPLTYTQVILNSIRERHRWRRQYSQAKADRGPVDSDSATGQPP